ncbi:MULTISPECIES: methyl-accepting chemotaxis protein [Marinilactibacillus]|uniref:Chemotaxis protein n=1 Tax=Marinilactibacillus psychrotolerans TaxID=191770 RepID=A0AAV3WX11_9LACT|nr:MULTISPECIES: methyl-accepting chemotaxis protein [Marinilactibacillus]GEL67062.1 chemotaxis protein [Marinilactibacillus psychrotolerans]GEQ36207.1 chemotaxis protein [Marinilactibacillus psychrotolerans]SDC78208.1 methyl-accepting chemotaxis sensory transducer with Pas/Pac sensor [Marinilactibacillus psychrotolerans]
MMENVKVEKDGLHEKLIIDALEQNIAIIRFDINRRVIYVNDNFANVLGYNKEELYGKEHKLFCFPDFSESPAYEELWRNLLRGMSFQDKIIRKNANSEIVWLEATYFPIYDEAHNEVIGVAKVATDITARQNEIEKVTDDLMEMSKKLTESSQLGIKRGKDLLSESQEMSNLSAVSTNNLSELQKKNRSIQNIIETIQDIASNTNLLAINASIEAAHAGDYGLGFGVIAQEVKNLSQKVSESAQTIGKDILAVTNNINLVVEGNGQLKERIEMSEKEIEGTIKEFNQIDSESNNLQKQAKKLDTII